MDPCAGSVMRQPSVYVFLPRIVRVLVIDLDPGFPEDDPVLIRGDSQVIPVIDTEIRSDLFWEGDESLGRYLDQCRVRHGCSQLRL